MLRWARRIAIFLLLGAIVNIAVAWGCALFAGSAPKDVSIIVLQGSPICMVTVFERFGFQCLQTDGDIQWPAFIRRIGSDDWTAYPDDLKSEDWASEGAAILTRAGWPLLSMEGWELDAWRLPSNAPRWKFDRSQNARWGWSWDRLIAGTKVTPLLPLRPIPLGFTVDSGLYAMIAWLIVYCGRRARELIRDRCGQCPVCGYPRGTSPVCTECGQPLATPSARARSS